MNSTEKAKQIFLTSDKTLTKICKELGLSYSTVSKVAAKENWKNEKEKAGKKRTRKKVAKVIDRQASSQAGSVSKALEKEIGLANKIMSIITKALEDDKQLNTHIVTVKGEKMIGEELYAQWQEERQFRKVDSKELLDLVNALGKAQDILSKAQKTMSKYEEEKIKIERERLEIEKRKVALLEAREGEAVEEGFTGVVELPQQSIEELEQQANAYLREFEEKEKEKEAQNVQ